MFSPLVVDGPYSLLQPLLYKMMQVTSADMHLNRLKCWLTDRINGYEIRHLNERMNTIVVTINIMIVAHFRLQLR